MLPEAGQRAAVKTKPQAASTPKAGRTLSPPRHPSAPHNPRYSLGHAAGGAAVFGFLQTDNADSGAAIERRHGLSRDALPPQRSDLSPQVPRARLFFRFLNQDQSARSTYWQSKAMD